jgi:hypothetical protein
VAAPPQAASRKLAMAMTNINERIGLVISFSPLVLRLKCYQWAFKDIRRTG